MSDSKKRKHEEQPSDVAGAKRVKTDGSGDTDATASGHSVPADAKAAVLDCLGAESRGPVSPAAVVAVPRPPQQPSSSSAAFAERKTTTRAPWLDAVQTAAAMAAVPAEKLKILLRALWLEYCAVSRVPRPSTSQQQQPQYAWSKALLDACCQLLDTDRHAPLRVTYAGLYNLHGAEPGAVALVSVSRLRIQMDPAPCSDLSPSSSSYSPGVVIPRAPEPVADHKESWIDVAGRTDVPVGAAEQVVQASRLCVCLCSLGSALFGGLAQWTWWSWF